MSDRPSANDLNPCLLEPGPKLSQEARHHLIGDEVRCIPKRHLLAAVVSTTHGLWVLWRGDLKGRGWRCGWHDDFHDPAALQLWCPCAKAWTLDLSMPSNPRLMR
jgi:hypothetical protein